MAISESIDKAQARIHAHAGDWGAFSNSIASIAKNNAGLGRANEADWLAELWYEFALAGNQTRLAQYSHWLVETREKSQPRVPVLSKLVDEASKDTRLQWLVQREELHDIWIAATDIPVPNKEWRARHHVFGDIHEAYYTWMRAQPDDVQQRQKSYLAKYGEAAVLKKSLLYHAMCAYQEPTPEQVRAAAMAHNPVYDMKRLELHFPGIQGLRSACEGMGMKQPELRDTLGRFMDGQRPCIEHAIPEQGFDAVF